MKEIVVLPPEAAVEEAGRMSHRSRSSLQTSGLLSAAIVTAIICLWSISSFSYVSDVTRYVETLRSSRRGHVCDMSGRSWERLNFSADVLQEPRGIPDTPDTLLIYVHNTQKAAHRRQLIRDTWGNPRFYTPEVMSNLNANVAERGRGAIQNLNFTVRVFFVVGLSPHHIKHRDSLQPLLTESGKYQDILLLNFQDDYYNITYKALTAMAWIADEFDHVRYVIKADDDMMLQTYEWMGHTRTLERRHSGEFIHCCVWTDAPVFRVGKWAVKYSEYSPSVYPDFCPGGAYLMTLGAIDAILDAFSVSQSVVWRIDDVFVTGILAEERSVPRIPIKSGCKGLGFPEHLDYFTRYTDITPGSFLVAHAFQEDKWEQLWYELVNNYTKLIIR